MKTVTVIINGSALVFSKTNGVLLALTEPEGNCLIDTTPELGGLIDVSCPLKEFGPFRLASRYTRRCAIECGDARVTVELMVGASMWAAPLQTLLSNPAFVGAGMKVVTVKGHRGLLDLRSIEALRAGIG